MFRFSWMLEDPTRPGRHPLPGPFATHPHREGRDAARLLGMVLLFLFTLISAWLLGTRTASGDPAPPPSPSAPRHGGLYRQIALELADEVRPWARREDGPRLDAEWARVRLFDLALACAAASRGSEDPRRRLEALSLELFGRRGFKTLDPPPGGFAAEHLLLEEVLSRRAGSPLALALVVLSAAELLSPPLDLRVVTLPSGAAARFADGQLAWSLLIAPGAVGGRVLRDDQLRSLLAGGSPPRATDPFLPLEREELMGALLGEFARAARERGEVGEARKLLGKAVEVSPRRVSLWLDLADLAVHIADPELERKALDGAADAAPVDPRPLVRRASLQRRSGDLEGAQRDLERAMGIQGPIDPVIFLELGDLERRLGRREKAIAAYRQFLAAGAPGSAHDAVRGRVRELELEPSLLALDGAAGYSARFEALGRVAGARTPRATAALIAALRSENLRFARLAWKSLRESTGQEIGFDAEAWERWWSSSPQGLAWSASAAVHP